MSGKPISHKMIVLLSLFLIFVIISSDQSIAMLTGYSENPVDNDSNIDLKENIGDDGLNSYLDAQALGGNNQSISENNTYSGTLIEDPIDNNSTDIDSSPNFGSLSNFSQSQSLDSNYASFSEELGNDNSIDLSSNEYFLVGGGTGSTISFGSPQGTIEMWLKYDSSDTGRPWGQNGNFEVKKSAGSAFSYDFGVKNALVASKTSWNVGQWYFLAFTWDEIDDDLFFYWGDEVTLPNIDGSNTVWTSNVSTLPNSDNLIFKSPGGNQPVDGHLDEFRYWNVERNLTEIRGDYDTILTGSEVGLQNYYQFENSLTDLTGSADLIPAGVGTYTYQTTTSTALTDGYHMDQEVQFTNLIDFMEIEEISIYAGSTGTEDIEVSYWNGTAWSLLFSDLNASSWNNATVQLTGSNYTLKFEALYSASDNIQDTWLIDTILFVYRGEGAFEDYIDQESDIDSSGDVGLESSFANMQATDTIVNILTESIVTTNYELDQEMQFINIINPKLPLIQISIKTGNIGSEAIKVQYWDGGQWKEIADDLSANIWNNFTVTQIITTSTFTIRFIDGNRASDSSNQDVWEIDSVILSHISKKSHYEMDWEHQSQGIDTTKEFYKLTIYGNSSDVTEDFQVQLWNQSSSSWNGAFSQTIGTSLQWYNYSIPSNGIIGSTITWRYTGTLDGSDNLFDTNQNTLLIDYAGIASYEELPTMQSNPPDLLYTEGTTGNNLQWIATDSNSTTYTIYLDDIPGAPLSWTSGSPINYSVDGLAQGGHNVTIVIRDISDNIIIDYVLVTVTDTVPPVIDSPDDIIYEAGDLGNKITWNATDFAADTYQIWNSTQIIQTNTPWTSGIPIVFNIDGLLKGVYNYTIIIYDLGSNFSNDTVFVTVTDTTDPVIIGPTNISFEIGEIGNTIDWNISDIHPGTYTIYENGSQVDTNSWNNGENVTYGLDSLLAGSYEYVITVFDNNGNTLNQTVNVLVTDVIKPLLTNPSNIQFAEGSLGNNIVWTATDFDPGTYIIYQNDTQIETSTWVSGIGISYNLDSVLKGTYNYTIVTYDRTGNSDVDTVIVTVSDETIPTVTNPDDFQYFEGETGSNINITWHTIDNYPVQLSIFRDGIKLYSFGWINDTDTVVIVDRLLPGLYNYTILITDESGLFIQDTVWVTVVDNIPPVVDNPNDVTYTLGFEGNTIEWISTDLHASNYTIYNDTLHILQSGVWISSNPIVLNVDGLGPGTYNYTIFLSDVEGNLVNDTVTIKVTEESVFTDIPDDTFYIDGATGNYLNWTVSDSNEDWYILYRDGTAIDNSFWNSTIPLSFNIDGLTIGVYNFTLYINDTDGNEVVDMAWVTVSDMPVWGPLPEDLIYFEDTSGNNVNWSASDMFPNTYEIYNDTHLVDSGSWTSGTNISLNLDGLPKGVYNYTIYIFDTVNNTISDNFTVTVLDNTPPSISSPSSDLEYPEGSSPKSLNWTATDNYADIYEIWNETNQLISGTWISGENVNFNVSGLSYSIIPYNFTIIFFDKSGNNATDTAWVTVVDNILPSIPLPSSNLEYSEGSFPKSLNWTATDNYADTFEIWNSTNFITSGIWTSGENVNFDVSGLSYSITPYNFTIIFTDESGNNMTHTAWVTVIDGTDPIFTYTPENLIYSEGSSGNSLNWTGLDSYSGTYDIYNDTGLFTSGSWTSDVNVTVSFNGLLKGLNNYTITFYDQSGNSVVHVLTVTIIDTTFPSIFSIPDFEYAEGATNNILSWSVTDNYANTYEIWNSTDMLTSGNWSSSVNISYAIDGYLLGNYNFTLIVNDISGNSDVDTVMLNVIDDKFPEFVSRNAPLGDGYAEDQTGNSISWIATDDYALNYEIWNSIDMLTFGNWTSGSEVIYDIDGLNKGTYNFTIIFFDTSGHQLVNTFIITITDETIPLINSPSDISYLEADPNRNITWTVSDKYADYYEIWNGSVLFDSGNWTSGTIIIYVNGSILGDYTYILYINDTSGNTVNDAVLVRVVELMPPIFTFTPVSIQYNEETVIGQLLNWKASDTYNESYIIYQNGSSIQSGFWNNGENISLSLDGLSKGFYNFTIIVMDSSQNSNKSTVWVNIFDESPPTLSSPPSDFSYESGETGNKLTWTFIDNYDDTYEIYHNDLLVDFAIWKSSSAINYGVDFDLVFGAGGSPLSVGFHNFTIVVRDKSGNEFIDTVIVEVTDTIDPIFTIISSPIYNYTESSTGKQLNWTIFDKNPDHIVIQRNGVDEFTSLWSSSDITEISYANLIYEKGVWNYTIIVFDESGHFAIHTTIVTVIDITSPIFENPLSGPQSPIIEGTQVDELRWSMFDNHPNYYVMYLNDVVIDSINWNSFQVYKFDINGLAAGFYNYTLFGNDTSSNTLISTILITVEDHQSPKFSLQTSISNYTEGTVGHNLIWNVEEIHPYIYNLMRDGILLLNATYENNETIIWNIDDLDAGSYNFTINFIDESSNKLIQSFILEVIDERKPVLLSEPVGHTINETTIENFLVWEATDIHASTYVFLLGDTTLRSGSWIDSEPILINIDGFEPGFYDFKIKISDESGNSIISFVTIRVRDPLIIDTVPPVIDLRDKVYALDTEEFSDFWLTTVQEGNKGVDGGTVQVQLFLNLLRLQNFEETTRSDGNYTILFDYTDLVPGNYTWKISFLKDGFQEWSDIEIPFELLPHSYSITIIIQESVQQGREFTIVASLKYLNNDSLSPALSLSEYSPISEDFSVAPANVSVDFIIVLLYEDGTVKEILKSDKTNVNGIAKVVLSKQATNNLLEILSINVNIMKDDINNSAELDFNPDDLPEVKEIAPTTFELAIEFLRENTILIPSVLIIILSLAFIGLQFNNKRVEKIRQINNAVKSANVELQAIKSIESIIIQTSSKLTIYEEQVATSNVNSTLIGGMVTAFSSFLDEVGKSELFGFEMMEREGLSLTLHQGKISNIIIISTDKLPIVILAQIKEAQKEIESSFKNNFTNTARGVIRLTPEEIHPIYHKAGFKLDLLDDLLFNENNIKKMLRQRSLSRALKHNIRFLYEFPESNYFGVDKFQLNDIIEFFKSKGITERVSSRTIMLAYQFDVINSIQFDSRELE